MHPVANNVRSTGVTNRDSAGPGRLVNEIANKREEMDVLG